MSAWLHATFARRAKSRGEQLLADSFKFSPLEQAVVVDCVSVLGEFAVAAPITNCIGGNAKKLGGLVYQQIGVGGLHGVLPELRGEDCNHSGTLPNMNKDGKYLDSP